MTRLFLVFDDDLYGAVSASREVEDTSGNWCKEVRRKDTALVVYGENSWDCEVSLQVIQRTQAEVVRIAGHMVCFEDSEEARAAPEVLDAMEVQISSAERQVWGEAGANCVVMGFHHEGKLDPLDPDAQVEFSTLWAGLAHLPSILERPEADGQADRFVEQLTTHFSKRREHGAAGRIKTILHRGNNLLPALETQLGVAVRKGSGQGAEAAKLRRDLGVLSAKVARETSAWARLVRELRAGVRGDAAAALEAAAAALEGLPALDFEQADLQAEGARMLRELREWSDRVEDLLKKSLRQVSS